MENEKIIVLSNYQNLMEAEIVKARLIDSGVECFLSNTIMTGLNPVYNDSYSGIKLHIFERDLKQAQAILNEAIEMPEQDGN
jgi:hypothetical protein